MKITKSRQWAIIEHDNNVIKVYIDESGKLKTSKYNVIDYGPYGQGFGLKLLDDSKEVLDWYYHWRDGGGMLEVMEKEYWLSLSFDQTNNADLFNLTMPSNNSDILIKAQVSVNSFGFDENLLDYSNELNLIITLMLLIKIRDEKFKR